MADTFAIDPGQGPQQAQTQVSQMRGPSGGLQLPEAGAAQAAAQQAQMDQTGQLLFKMAGDILAPKVQAEARKQYFYGMQRAMSGEALDEIIDKSPAWANIFGPSAAIQGARQYTQEATVAKWAAGVEARMPELAKTDPSQVADLVYGELQGMFSGDAETDGKILASATEMMGPILKQHTKAHYAYTQNKANQEQLNTWGAQADVLNKLMADPTASDEDRAATQARFLSQISPFAGQTDASYEKNIAQLITGTAERGQFQVMNLMKTTPTPDGQTVWDKVPYEVRTKLDAGMAQYGRLAINEALPQFGLEMEMIVNDTAQDPRQILERVQAFNAKVAKATGVPVDVAQAIPTQQLLSMTGTVLKAQAAQAAAGKDDAAATALAGQLVLRPGQLASYKALGMIKDKHAEQAMGQAWASNPDPKQRAAMLNANPTIKSDLIEAAIASDLSSPVYSDAVLMHGNILQNLTESGMAAYPSHITAKLKQFNTKVQEGWEPKAAWEMAPTFVEVGKNTIRDKDRSDFEKAVVKVVQKENPWIESLGIGNELTKSSQATAYAILAGDAKRLGGGAGMSQDAAVASAYYRAIQTNAMQVYGQHIAMVASPQLSAPLNNYVLGTQKETAEAFDSAMQAKAKAAGIPTDDYSIARLPDQGGKAIFMVNSVDEKGKPYNFMLSSDEISASLKGLQEKKVPGANKQKTPFGHRTMW